MNLQVVQDLKGRIQRLPNFQRNVVSVRRQLMGIATSPEHKRYYILSLDLVIIISSNVITCLFICCFFLI